MRILLVDPDAADLAARAEALTALGHEVMWAAELAEVPTLITWPDLLVVTDRPGLDALTLAEVVRRRRAALPVAVIHPPGQVRAGAS